MVKREHATSASLSSPPASSDCDDCIILPSEEASWLLTLLVTELLTFSTFPPRTDSSTCTMAVAESNASFSILGPLLDTDWSMTPDDVVDELELAAVVTYAAVSCCSTPPATVTTANASLGESVATEAVVKVEASSVSSWPLTVLLEPVVFDWPCLRTASRRRVACRRHTRDRGYDRNRLQRRLL